MFMLKHLLNRWIFYDLVINDGGVYWRFLYQWDLPKDGFLAKIQGELEKAVQHAVEMQVEPSMAIFEQGVEQWKSTLNM
jgi:hypothetical protein